MAGDRDESAGVRRHRARIVVWSLAAFLLLLPLLAMQVTDQVNWTATDFAVFGALLLGTGALYEGAVRMAQSTAYRAATGVALAAACLLVWLNLAVGVIGTENDPANMMYGAVLATGVIGAAIARFRPNGMARALGATALAQAAVAAIAAVAGLGHPASPPLEILGVNALFVALWLLSAWLFRKAARGQSRRGTAAIRSAA